MINTRVIVDAGPLIALFRKNDSYHRTAVNFLCNTGVNLVTTIPVITEVFYFLNLAGKIALIKFIEAGGVMVSDGLDFQRIGQIMGRYSDREVDLADASLICLAENSGIDEIATIDRNDFEVYRIGHNKKFKNIFPAAP